MKAARENNVTQVLVLLGCPGVDINHEDKIGDGETPLYEASSGGHLQVVKLLVSDPWIDVNKAAPLVAASANGHVEVVKELLAQPQINVNRFQLNKSIDYARTGGYWQSKQDRQDIVEAVQSCQSLLQQDHTC